MRNIRLVSAAGSGSVRSKAPARPVLCAFCVLWAELVRDGAAMARATRTVVMLAQASAAKRGCQQHRS